MKKYEVVVCGAGIVGIATAYYLTRKYGQKNLLLLDKLPPMTLTTSKSGENFRDYWPQTCMTEFCSHSLDLMQELIETHGDVFKLRSSGYDFVSEKADREIFASAQAGTQISSVSRTSDATALRRDYPWLSPQIRQVAHINRAGAVDVYALGTLMLNQARAAGTALAMGEVTGIEELPDSGYRLHVSAAAESRVLETSSLVLAAGPFVNGLARMLRIEVPVTSIRQHKFVIPDPQAVIPENMPFTIFADSQHLEWDDDERELISEDPEYHWLLEEFPPGLHIKPEGSGHIKLGWAYNRKVESPDWKAASDKHFPNIVMRGASRFIPGLRQYRNSIPTPIAQFSGYYTRTRENWPLIGPLEKPGLFAAAALSGYGTMAACAAGELCADHMLGAATLPAYARNFHPERYHDQEIMAEISTLSSDGQL
ncbi:MAG: FAD-binding oxidoreductase [Gammaproteobacteria bacterium]|nr:FAD-binding oxidoreductase [Gammaproteobacteria bacterium]